jgi:drug/metabolite transporter (DMT)-like permease
MPVVVILMNITINKEERPNATIISGVLLGMAGIALVFSEHLRDLSNPQYIGGIIVTLIGVFAWAGASIWTKKHSGQSNIFMNTGLQMFFGGLWLYPLSVMYDDYAMISFTAGAIYPFIYLVFIGSIVAFLSYHYALRKLPMTVVSLYAYINPLVAVTLGWLVLDEKLNWKIGIAFLITIAGIYIVNKGYQTLKTYRTALNER